MYVGRSVAENTKLRSLLLHKYIYIFFFLFNDPKTTTPSFPSFVPENLRVWESGGQVGCLPQVKTELQSRTNMINQSFLNLSLENMLTRVQYSFFQLSQCCQMLKIKN